MRRFPTGVMVLTVPAPEGMHAVTVNAVTSVSLEPTLMLVCLEKNAQSHQLVQQAGGFVLNILSERQRELGERFAFDRVARTRPNDYATGHRGASGALILDDSLGYLECRVVDQFPGGDHTIFIVEVTSAAFVEVGDDPLLYFMSHFRMLAPQ